MKGVVGMREVELYKWVKKGKDDVYTKVLDTKGKFHQFGLDYEQFESDTVNFSTAIVELENGELRNHPVELVKFIEADE